MSATKLSDTLAQQAIDAYAQTGTDFSAGKLLGLPEQTARNRRREGEKRGLKPTGILITGGDEAEQLKRQIGLLEAELKSEKKRVLDEGVIRQYIIGLNRDASQAVAPKWMEAPLKSHAAPGVPTLFLSDLHWGEVVQPAQINHVNEYNLPIAHKRFDNVLNTSVDLLKIIDPQKRYPGLVVALGGDMISGDIHEELKVTNQLPTIPTVLDLLTKLKSGLRFLVDTYGRMVVVCVTGNHGRNTMKMWNKDRHATSFDWLLYTLLAKDFENDDRVTFLIPDGPDAYYKVYDHRYLLTHGDQFRGGDGMIGALGPITRGNHKKQSRNARIDMPYDTLMMGHWHQDIFLRGLIVNNCLKGYDEYAYSNNFSFALPSQQLWVTHPQHGPTWHMPVYAERVKKAPKVAWAAVAA